MKIEHVQHAIAESLANLPTSNLPEPLQGLRHLPLTDHTPRVTLCKPGGRRIRWDADASYFDSHCTVRIEFVPTESAHEEHEESEAPSTNTDRRPAEPNSGASTDAVVEALRRAEPLRPFVGLTWFRDRVLPASGAEWARNPETVRRLLRSAIEQHLVLTSQVPNPNQPDRPVTAIRVNRTHPRFGADPPERHGRFRPIRIHGGSISETVLDDRR